MSIQWEPDKRALRFLELCAARKRDRPDSELAARLDLSVEDLYQTLANDGYPVCPECGALHPDEEHRRAHAARKRKARGSGGGAWPVEVPVSEAVPLFERAAERLQEGVEDVRRLRLRRQDRRFVAKHELYGAKGKRVLTDGLEGDSVLVYEREKVHPDFWRDLCEKHGLDPEEHGSLMIPMDYDRPEGGRDAPPESLVAQVANYVLTGGDVEELLSALHPEPDKVDRAALYRDDANNRGPVAGLRRNAEQIATAVCGGTFGRGRPAPEISKEEHRVAAYVREQRAQGTTDEEIVAALRDGDISPLSIPITLDEVRRLGGLNLT